MNVHFTPAENFIIAKHAKKTGLELGAYVRRMLSIVGSDENIKRRLRGLTPSQDSSVSSLVLNMREFPKGNVPRTVTHSFNISIEQHSLAGFLSKEKGMRLAAFLRSLAIAPPLPGMPIALTKREVSGAQALVNQAQDEVENRVGKAANVSPLQEGGNLVSGSEVEGKRENSQGFIESKKKTVKWRKAEEQLNDSGYVWEGGEWIVPEQQPMTANIEVSYDLIRPILISTTKKTLPCSVSLRLGKSEEQEARDLAAKHGLPLLTYARVAGLVKGRLAKLSELGTSVLYDFYFSASELRKLRSSAKQAEMSIETYLRRRILGGFDVPSLFDDKGQFKLWNVL